MNARSPGASVSAIQHHYDISNDFYALWLDRSLTYSCALWDQDEDLATAQSRKIDWHLQHAGVAAGGRLLDVGCGWGALLERAKRTRDIAFGVGLTLSAAQVAWIKAKNLPDVDVRLESWSEHIPDAPYDAIVAIGAFEHFARPKEPTEEKVKGYRQFFSFCHKALKPGGRMSLQTITYENSDARDFNRFFGEQIFPESDLPHAWEIDLARSGLFESEIVRNDRGHYVRTLRCWLERLRAHREAGNAMVGTATVAAYEKCFALMAIGFYTGRMNLARIAMRRIDRSGPMANFTTPSDLTRFHRKTGRYRQLSE